MIDRSLKVSQLMTTDVLFVRPDDIMEEVDKIFRRNNIHHIPVVDSNQQVVGMISRSDYYKILHGFTLFRTEKSESYNQAILRSLLAKEVMVRHVAKLNPEDTVTVAAGFFRENLFHAIPVVDNIGKLVGIITTFDLLNFAFQEPVLLE
ncbi:MAG: hypothetical protein RLY31_3136 [Bacteroidota bacterium]|jgi:CBS domain-containing protein